MTTTMRRLTVKGQVIAALPLPGAAFDPDVFPACPGRDYEAIAETSWYSAQMWASSLAGDDLALAHLAERERRCSEWFMDHRIGDPRWYDALTRKRQIENEQDAVRVARRVHARACWSSCADVYASLGHLHDFERQSWLVEYAPGMDVSHPVGVWRHLRGDERPGGTWPLDPEDAVVEGRLARSEVWNRIELRRAVRRGRRGR